MEIIFTKSIFIIDYKLFNLFLGLIMEPNKRYTQVVEKPFHISQAAMDTSTGDTEPCQVMVVVDGKNFLICTLQKNKTVQVPLDMYFKTGDAVSFLINGLHSFFYMELKHIIVNTCMLTMESAYIYFNKFY